MSEADRFWLLVAFVVFVVVVIYFDYRRATTGADKRLKRAQESLGRQQ